MKKKFLLSIILMCISIFALGMLNVSAETGSCGKNLMYTYSSGDLTITGTGSMTNYTDDKKAPWYNDYVINVTIGDGVTSIGDNAFKNCKLVRVTIPDSVTSIGDYAFHGCNNLTSITIPDNVTSIGKEAFSGCTGFVQINWNAKKVADFTVTSKIFYKVGADGDGIEVIFGDNVERIPACLFYNISNVKTVTIPNNVTSIGDSAFEYCSGLTSVTIGNSVTSIGSHAFYECSSLESITIPGNMTSIGSYAFYDCSGLTSVTIGNGVTSIGDCAFRDCSGLTSVTIGNDVTSIGSYAFDNCSGLTNITIPDSVTSIDNGAFYNCSSLTSITIPDNVTSIGSSAFSNCTNITQVNWNAKNVADFSHSSYSNDSAFAKVGTSCDGANIVFGKNVEHIPAKIFYTHDLSYAPKILSITIGENVTSIGDPPGFSNCAGLSRVIWNAKKVADFTSSSSIFYKAGEDDVDIEVVFGDSVEHIPAYLFYNISNVKTVTIPNNVTSIGDSAFEYCSGLTSLTIPDSVTSIGYDAFYGCSGLMSLTISSVNQICEDYKENVSSDEVKLNQIFRNLENSLISLTLTNETVIPDNAFSGYENLTDITLNDGITSIGVNAFDNCGYANDETNWDGEYLYLGNYLIDVKPTVFAAKVKEGTTVMIDGIFSSCDGLLKATLPESLINISNEAFRYCDELLSVNIPSKITTIGDGAFLGCCNLTKINIPDTVVEIGEHAFNGCEKLDGVYITDIEEWCKIIFGGNAYLNDKKYSNPLFHAGSLYINDVLAENIVIPESITQLNDCVFCNCDSLKTIKLPDNLISIGSFAFDSCGNLAQISIPAKVTSIGKDTFVNCSNLNRVYITDLSTWCKFDFSNLGSNPLRYGANLYLNNTLVKELSIPSDITTINKNQFYNCGSITAVKIHSNVEKIEENAFYGCENIEYVEIPKDLFYIRNNAFYGCDSLAEVHYGGTESEWDEIIIADGNDSLKNARVQSIYYITLIDDDGNTSSITCQPNTKIKISDIEKKYMHKVTLYTDEAMTKEFDASTDIVDNMTLYVYVDYIGTETTISAGGKTFTVKPMNIANGNTVILSLYNNGIAVDIQSASYNGKAITFTTDKEYTNAKVMVWESLSNLKPVCNVEIVK